MHLNNYFNAYFKSYNRQVVQLTSMKLTIQKLNNIQIVCLKKCGHVKSYQRAIVNLTTDSKNNNKKSYSDIAFNFFLPPKLKKMRRMGILDTLCLTLKNCYKIVNF